MPEAKEAGVTMFGKHSNQVTLRLQLTATLTLSNHVGRTGTLSPILV